jgi:outer membrane protein assembly factor BamD (BamD/ComL family)
LERISNSRSSLPGRAPSPHESYKAELRLLKRAQSDYADQDFSAALALVAEHARRFPNGRLAEAREALRVQSLSRAGRSDDAQRASDAFARRFPHSVLLSRFRLDQGI